MRSLVLVLSVLLGLGHASAQDKLTVYTYESFITEWGPGPAVKQAFEATCACTLEWVGVQDGVALLTRLKLEGGQSKADIVLGLDQNLIAEAAATGFFAPHGIVLRKHELPIEWHDPLFLPYDWGHFAVIYDRERMQDPPRSLEALVDGGAERKIVLQDPRTSTPGLGFLLWMKAVYGDKAPDAWTRLKPKILTVTPGWSEAYGMFTKGEADMVLSYTTSPAYHMIEEKTDRYQAAVFTEGHYLQVEVAGMLKAAPNKALAEKFLAFMLTPAFQDTIPTRNWMFPAMKTSQPLPEAFGQLAKPERTLMFPPEEVAAKRQQWIDEWLEAMSR